MPPPRRWIASGLIAAGEVTALVGPPFAGKSAVAARLAADVSAGERFLGIATERAPVLYVAAERASVTARRLVAARCREGMGEGLDIALSSGPLLLGEKESVSAALQAIADVEAKLEARLGLVIIDTLASCMGVLDENSQRDAGRIVEGLQRIANAGPAVVVIHHTSKSGSEVRGSSVLTGAFDRVLSITGGRGKGTLKVSSVNDGEAGATFPFKIEGVEDGTDAETGAVRETVLVRDADRTAKAASAAEPDEKPLSRDARLALQALEALGGSANHDIWRSDTLLRFGERKSGTKRQAFFAARRVLKERGLIEEVNEIVSVRNCQKPSELTLSDGGERVSAQGPYTRPPCADADTDALPSARAKITKGTDDDD